MAREAVLVPLLVASARKLKRRLADEQNEVLDALRRKEPVRSLDVLVPWESEQSERYTDAIAAELVGAVQAGAASIGDGAEFDLGPTGILAPTRDAIAADLVVPLRERLDPRRRRRRRRQRRRRQEGARDLPGVEDPAHRRAARRPVPGAYARGRLRGRRARDAGALARRSRRAGIPRLRGQLAGRAADRR